MSWTARLISILRGTFRRASMERDMDAELRFHLASYTEDLVRSGIARDEAERRARIEFGHLEPLKEYCRQARGLRLMDEISQDLRYAVRMLRKSPGFAAIAVLTLALGIGANTSIFSVVNAWVLKPLAYRNPDQLVSIHSAEAKRGWTGPVSPGDLYDFRHTDGAFEEICGWANPFVTLQLGDRPQQMVGGRVNWQFFRMLGVTPPLGRDFLEQDDRAGAPRVVLIGQSLWKSHFAGDPSLVGRTIRLDGDDAMVVGILPADFHLPLAGPAQLWMPLALSEEDLKNRRILSLDVIARLKPGFSLAGATSYLETLARRLQQSYPETNTGRSVAVRTLSDEIGRQGGNDRALVLFGLVGCILLIACGNVANLIVSRAVARQKEIAVRIAMGAGKTRVLRQLLTENLVLFLIAACCSVLFASWGVHWIAESIPYNFRPFLPNEGRLQVDLPTFLYTLGISVTMGLLFGFAPAFHCWRIDVNDALKESTSRSAGNAFGSRLKNWLIVSEISLTMVVLVASGLLIKGLVRMYASDPGFHPAGLVTAPITLSNSKYADLKLADAFYRDVLERIAAKPGIQSVAAASFLPYSGSASSAFYAIDGRPSPSPGSIPFFSLVRVTPGYFSVMGQTILRGREFSERDNRDASPVIIINQTMARRNWPNEDPVGRRIRYGAKLDRVATIVGVVVDTEGMNDPSISVPVGFLPQHQLPGRSLLLVLRTNPNKVDIAAEIEQAVLTLDKEQPVSDVRTMEDLMAERQSPFRIVGEVTLLFSGLALFLAALGIYGVVAYSVAARRQEFGIRMALGAARRDVLSLVVSQGLKLALIGLAIGVVGSLAVTRFMESILYHVSPTDAPTFAFISLLLLVVAALACYFPARRASNADPTQALRCE
jgi:putative ABC transport system permease protein